METLNFSALEKQEIFKKLDTLIDQLAKLQKVQNDKIFLDTEELCITMNISKRTAFIWRDKGIIGYIQIGRKFYYKLTDILTLLDNNYTPPKL